LKQEYFPDYEIPVIEHTPWIRPPIRVPKAIESDVRSLIRTHCATGRYEDSCASYRSRVFPVLKKSGALRLVHDLQDLNAVTIRDSALPPRVDDFAESFVGRQIYGIADLFAGYDARILAEASRDLTTFASPDGAKRVCCLPQGYCNAVPEFIRDVNHVIEEEEEEDVGAFVDDVGIKGPEDDYGDAPIDGNPDIRRFVFEYLTLFDRILLRLGTAGFTASGTKLIPATPKLDIVGSTVSREGWHLEHGLASKILKWPIPENVSEVRGFLGTVGVARRWIEGFARIAKPLTLLCRNSDEAFEFGQEALDAVNTLKQLVSSAPVLKPIDYKLAARIRPPPRTNNHGLVILAVDSSKYGAGWILYQMHETDKHPALFGSCTYSATESNYSQPKAELYGVFRAMKECCHRIWGCHFQLEVDAKYLEQMLVAPDLPNAPMTRWVSYVQLFDYTLVHVPAAKFLPQDGLSRRRRAVEDSDESDGEDRIDDYIGAVVQLQEPLADLRPSYSVYRVLRREMLDYSRSLGVDRSAFTETNILVRQALVFPATFDSLKAERIRIYEDSFNREAQNGFAFNANVRSGQVIWHSFHDRLFQPGGRFHRYDHDLPLEHQVLSWCPSPENPSPFHASLLRNIDDYTYVGTEFEVRKQSTDHADKFLWFSGEEGMLPYTTYNSATMFEAPSNDDATTSDSVPQGPKGFPIHEGDTTRISRTDHHYQYAPLSPLTSSPPFSMPANAELIEPAVTCATHQHKVHEDDGDDFFGAIKAYLKDGSIPEEYQDSPKRRSFIGKANRYIVKDERLWRLSKTAFPRLVITDPIRREQIIAEAHNDAGHRGREATYKRVSDRFYFPGLYDKIAYFIRSCNVCQRRSRTKPIVPLRPTISPTVFRRLCCDTIVLPDGVGGFRFIAHATDDVSKYPSARALRKNDAGSWAKFLYEEIITRFGCIPELVCDGGSEFKGAARILAEKYNIRMIVSSPYHPEGNGISERDGATLTRALLAQCGDRPNKWPHHLVTVLWALRTTVSRVTGYSPHFLLYGQHELLPFDIIDRSWYLLDWHTVEDTADLIAMRAKQLSRLPEHIGIAHDRLLQERQADVERFRKKNARRIQTGVYPPGTWVLVHETWLDTQLGNKGALRWAGPYVVVEQHPSGSYRIAELDGALLAESVAAKRLTLFYYRKDFQTLHLTIEPGFVSETLPDRLYPYTGVALGATWEDMLYRSGGRLRYASDAGPDRYIDYDHNFADILAWNEEFSR
ncbi:hypothetical protein EUX98_g9572, partial [Antrodiella citrinella]